jgi:peptidoglycan hydrolase-like protein with peptidoglycan-binding domain
LKADIEARRKAKAGRGDQAAVTAERAAEEAAQRKAEAEAASLREAEEEATKKAAADAAATRQAEQALAMATGRRKQAEADALAAANKVAMPRLNEEAETAEKGLSLEPADRQRLQVALTSLGFDTRGDDGVFGPRSREMIAHWQKARNQAATGFVTRAQQQALLKEAAAALSGYDEQRKADEELKGRTTAEAPVAAAGPPTGSADGLWRGTYECVRNGNFFPFTLKPEIHLKGGAGTWYTANPSWTNNQTMGISVSIDGTNVLVTRRSVASDASASTTPLSGRLEGNSIRASNNVCTMVLVRDVSPAQSTPPITSQPVTAAYDRTPALPSPDGLWRGIYKCEDEQIFGPPFVIGLKLHLTNGSARWRTEMPGRDNGFSFDVGVSVVRDIASVVRGIAFRQGTMGSQATLTGRYDGATINATGRESPYGRDCTLALTRS